VKKRFSVLAVLMALALVAAACGDSGSDTTTGDTTAATDAPTTEGGGDGSIWVLLPDSATSDRWENDDRRFFSEAFTAAGVDFNIVNAEGDAQTQITQAETALASGAKVLVVVSLDAGSSSTIIGLARENGAAVVDYDRLTTEGPGADVYVSFDNVAVGRLMGEALAANCPDGSNVAVLNGGEADNNAFLFKDGYDSVINPKFEDGSWTEVDDQFVPGWDNQEALNLFEQMLTAAGNDIDCAIAANDGIAGSVSAALQGAGLDPIPVTGQDATAPGVQRVLSGDQLMSVYKAIKAEAEAGAEAAILLLNGGDITTLTGGTTLNNGQSDVPFIALTPVAMFKDNIASTVIADGFRSVDEVCTGDFADLCTEAGIS